MKIKRDFVNALVVLCLYLTGCNFNSYEPVRVIPSDVTLYVSPLGSDTAGDGTINNPWATPHRAIEYLNQYWISPDATVKIFAKAGRYSLSSKGALEIKHPCGANIAIEGEGSKKVVFDWSDNSNYNGILVQNGCNLGHLNGIRLTGDGEHGRGMMAYGQSVISCGRDVEVDHFYDGIVAKDNSYVLCQNVYAHHNVYRGMLAVHRGHLLCNYALSEYNKIGIGIDDGSYAYAHYTSANNNTKIGFWARNSGKIYASASNAKNNGEYGYYMTLDSFINAHKSTATGNGIADYSPEPCRSDIPKFGNNGSWIFGDPNVP